LATNAAYAASRSWQVRQVGGGGRGVLAGQLLVEFLRLVRLHGEVVDLEADPVAGVASAPKPPPEGPTSRERSSRPFDSSGASVLPALFGWPGRTPAIPAISLPGSVFEKFDSGESAGSRVIPTTSRRRTATATASPAKADQRGARRFRPRRPAGFRRVLRGRAAPPGVAQNPAPRTTRRPHVLAAPRWRSGWDRWTDSVPSGVPRLRRSLALR
jgi:hypothetical protein